MASVVFYGDFNCPYCYVENERLLRMNGSESVEFRPVEHLPRLPEPWDPTDASLGKMLDDELARLRELVDDVKAARPAAIPSSKRSISAYAQAQSIDASAATDLRTALFRALWVDGADISLPLVVETAWSAAGLPGLPEQQTRDARGRAKLWSVEWDAGPFDRRVPVLATVDGRRLLGLAEPAQISAFLTDHDKGGHFPDVCRG